MRLTQSGWLVASCHGTHIAIGCAVVLDSRDRERLWPVVGRGECTLTSHVKTQLALDIFAHFYPPVFAQGHLLEVDDIVAGWTIAVAIELELIATQAYRGERERSTEDVNAIVILICCPGQSAHSCGQRV